MWQAKKSKSILNFALKNSSFYKEYYGVYCKPSDDWESLPKLNKDVLMKNFDRLNTVGIDFKDAYKVAIKSEKTRDFRPKIKNITVGLSSGTTGNRGLFLVSENERLAWAGAVLAKMMPKTLVSKQKIAFFLRANSNMYSTLNAYFIKFRFFDLLEDIDSHIDRLNIFQPSILIAPPSMLKILAKEMDHRLHISPIKIISVAEVLEPDDKAYIEKTFNLILHQIYQATEGFLAATCQYGTLHLNEDLIMIEKEYVDREKNKFIPVITDMFRKTQPIIRYRLNDILTEQKNSCLCGSPCTSIAQIDGRSDDLFYVKSLSDGKLKPLFHDYIRRAIITSSADILEYSVIQNDPANIHVNILTNGCAVAEIQKKIVENLNNLHIQLKAISPTVQFGKFSFPEKGAKLRRIIRNYPVKEGIYE